MSAHAPRHLLHIFPSFTIGGSQTRFGRLVTGHGDRYRHTVISLDRKLDMAERVPARLVTSVAGKCPPRSPLGALAEARRQIEAIRPDVLVTYNWGSMDWCMANRWRPIAPHVHIEDGFGPEERDRQLRRRVWARRLALSGTHTQIAVPSRNLERIAHDIWRLRKTEYIPNGINCARFAVGHDRRDGLAIGTVATLRREKNLAVLIEAAAKLMADFAELRLLIVGAGPEEDALKRAADRTGFKSRIEFTGGTTEPERFLAQMDVFALSSDTEQMPLSVLEAMASGLPVASFELGDVAQMVAEENRNFVSGKPGDERILRETLRSLLMSPELRKQLGSANRARAVSNYDETLMIERYARLFG